MFYGWYVVGCAFLVARWGWGLGFYGPSIYLVALQQEHAWSTATVSVAITAYYLMGALAMCVALELAGALVIVLGRRVRAGTPAQILSMSGRPNSP